MKRTDLEQNVPANGAVSYSEYRFLPDVISYAVWLYYRFPLSLRMVEELLAARGINFAYEICTAATTTLTHRRTDRRARSLSKHGRQWPAIQCWIELLYQ